MEFEILGDFDRDTLFCTGSFTKLLTTYICLSILSEKYDLSVIDDAGFLDTLCEHSPEAKSFLTLFQKLIGSAFSIRDICSFYSGLPYTFDVSEAEIAKVEAGFPFKHHSIMDEKTFLFMCENKITPVYHDRCKFHYSEIAIIFMGYLFEKIFQTSFEKLYAKFVIEKFALKNSIFSRKRTAALYCQDLSPQYDYPSIAILDHGYFCYSNGFFTTLNDLKKLLSQLFSQPVFQFMIDIKHARAASNRLLNGLTVEIRQFQDDIIYGYEGLSFSGCNLWAYSTKQKKGYITFHNSEEEVYHIVYGKIGYGEVFDVVPSFTQAIYKNFIEHYAGTIENKNIPDEYVGEYHRVNINDSSLEVVFSVAPNDIVIRNPEMVRYEVVYANGHYRVRGKDNIPGSKVGLMTSPQGHRYMYYDGTLYRRLGSS